MKFVIFTVLSLFAVSTFAQRFNTGNQDVDELFATGLKQNIAGTFARLFKEFTRKVALESRELAPENGQMKLLRTLLFEMRTAARKLTNLDPSTKTGRDGLVDLKSQLPVLEARLNRA